jgi:hypothetical protein
VALEWLHSAASGAIFHFEPATHTQHGTGTTSNGPIDFLDVTPRPHGAQLVEQEGLHGTLALDIDGAARPGREARRRKLSGCARSDLDLAR